MANELKIAFNEDTRVKFPATIHLLRLGYKYVSYTTAISNGNIDKSTKIYLPSFKKALSKINGKELSDEDVTLLVNKINSVISNNDLGKEFYQWLINPIDKVTLIDFKNPENNIFEVFNEFRFEKNPDEPSGHFRPDVDIFINGIPLAFLEVKKPDNEGGIQAEFNRMVNERYKVEEYKKYFNLLQLTCFSNNMEYETNDDKELEPKAGSFYSTPNGSQTTFNFFREEKAAICTLDEDDDEEIKKLLLDNGYSPVVMSTPEYESNIAINTPCNRFITSIFSKQRILFFLQYGIMYVDKDIREKHIMRYPQFFASQAILEKIRKGDKSGIIWHTQGSGKTELSMYCNRILKDYFASKKINARFFYVVDRLELLNQTKIECTSRGLEVATVDDKEAFVTELQRNIDMLNNPQAIGLCTVVNIQKFSDSLPEITNDYDANVQRIFFVDEAHRSYAKGTGEFFKNLMLVDRDAIFIAMTGTPLLSKKERSNLRFGDYIHKYFYDKSILDGYTLQIKKEEMATVARADIKKNLQFEGKTANEKQKILESDEYITALGDYIDKDFINFRYINDNDKTIAGMIVCSSNEQARKMQTWSEKNSKLITRVVIHNNPSDVNKEIQEDFKDAKNGIDLLIVHLMLTTGYDVKRLKKMYLLRVPREHSLLQTISRVNRPYRNPDGKVYKYGYISDFVDIDEEYDRTVAAYLKEIEDEIKDPDNPDQETGSKLVFDVNAIQKKYEDALLKLEDIYDHDNVEDFRLFLDRIDDKGPLFKIRKILQTILDCKTEFMLSRDDEKANQIDKTHFKKLLKVVQSRIDFINLSGDPVNSLAVLSEKDVVELIFEFINIKTRILNMEKTPEIEGWMHRLSEGTRTLQGEVSAIQNKDDERVIKLNELIRSAFDKMKVVNGDNFEELDKEIKEAILEAKRINEENRELAKTFNGHFAYVKTYQDYKKDHPEIDEDLFIELLKVIDEAVIKINAINNLVLTGRHNFMANVKKETSAALLKKGLYKELNLKDIFDDVLARVYVNLQLY
ncbi:MAG TPA: type I restriction endonuclease [Bacilli bacterium]|nr:type I restriction endonuclease [Bacilli bacterium]